MAWYNPKTWFKSDETIHDTANNLFDKKNGLLTQAGGFFGGLVYTAQEKAQDAAASIKTFNDFVVATLGENSERSKARRKIAMMWIKMHIFLILLTAVMVPIKMEYAVFYWGMASSPMIWTLTGGIGAFFFGSHMIRTRNEKGISDTATK